MGPEILVPEHFGHWCISVSFLKVSNRPQRVVYLANRVVLLGLASGVAVALALAHADADLAGDLWRLTALDLLQGVEFALGDDDDLVLNGPGTFLCPVCVSVAASCFNVLHVF